MNRELSGLKAKAKDLGADETKLIKASTIKTAAWVRMKCQYGCSGYGSNLCCPPHTPTPEQTQKVIDCYRTALLVHCGPGADPTGIIVTLEREAFLAGFYKAWGLGAGPCFLCKTCNLKRCVKQDKTRPSMESCGIDVYQTARVNGFPIAVVKDSKSRQNYYALLLIE
jgi:predicted metal-binding protein